MLNHSALHTIVGPRRALPILVLLGAAVLAQPLSAKLLQAQAVKPPPTTMSGHASADAAQLLVNFVTSVNRDEIALGKLALTKASSAEVRAYAQKIVDDHTNAMAAWEEKVPSWSLKIPDSASIVAKPAAAMTGSAAMANGISEVRDTTTGLRGGTTAAAIHSANLATQAQLKGLSGVAFDKAYLTAQRTAHEAVLKELSAQPGNYNDMQSLLAVFRTTVEKHLSEVRKLQP